MSNDTQYEVFQHYGTNAQRLAFTPTPAAGIQPIYSWWVTDAGANHGLWIYDTGWSQVGGGTGSLPATVQGDILYASGTNTLAALAKNATATRYLSNTGTTNNPAWAQVALTTGVSGILPVANGGSGSASGATILRASVPIAHADILTLPTAAVLLVTAPPPGSQINLIQAWLSADFTAGAYTGAAATFCWLALCWGGNTTLQASSYIADDSTITPALTYLSGFLANTKKVATLTPWQDTAIETAQWGTLAPTTASASVDNAALMLRAFNGGVDFGSGNASNTLKVTVYYTVETL